MWHRPLAATALVLLLGLTATAQSGTGFSRAFPPDPAVVGRLNLKTEWTLNLPIDSRRDSIATVQTIDDQLFVQTRNGRVIAIEAATGRVQWATQLGNGEAANVYPAATSSQFVYVVNVTRLYSFHRYTGVVEFSMDLRSPVITGLAADDGGVYLVMGMKSGTSGSHRIAVYNLPRPVVIADAAKPPMLDPSGKPVKDPKAVEPADALAKRIQGERAYRPSVVDILDEPTRKKPNEASSGGGMTGNRTPSIATLPKVTPPYTLDSDVATPSINLMPNLRKPYRLRTEEDTQKTASVNAMPPSVSEALAMTDLRPRGIEPPLRWEYGFSSRVLYPLQVSPSRVWAITDAQDLIALNKDDRKAEVTQHLDDPIPAAPGRAGTFIYIPLSTGFVISVDSETGQKVGGANITWRAAIGGLNNRTPFVTDNIVYAAGDNSGVAAIERKNGTLLWRSEETADQVLAANREFIYLRNRHGRLLVYDANRPTDPVSRQSLPLAGIDLAEFNIPIMNTVSDRIFLAADNGLLVCLRDQSAKYARPVRICPAPIVNAPVKVRGVITGNKDGTPTDPAEPKKDEPKKDIPKK
jgi:outer membrane protein assembly factor BamB